MHGNAQFRRSIDAHPETDSQISIHISAKSEDQPLLHLLRYILTYGRVPNLYPLVKFSYAIHVRAFRQVDNNVTIELVPWAFLEKFSFSKFNDICLPNGDLMIHVAIEEFTPLKQKTYVPGLSIRQHADHTSELCRLVLREG